MGRESAEGYYLDSFNYAALKILLLDPLKKGNLRYKAKAFNYKTDKGIISPHKKASLSSILIFDGVFTHRPELRDYWDYSIYLDISEEESMRRGLSLISEDEEKSRQLYETRYIAGQRIYVAKSDPKKYADIVINNNDPENPVIL